MFFNIFSSISCIFLETFVQNDLDENTEIGYLDYMAKTVTGIDGMGNFIFDQNGLKVNMDDPEKLIVEILQKEPGHDLAFTVNCTEKDAGGCWPTSKEKKIYIKNAMNEQLKIRVSCDTMYYAKEKDIK